MDDVRVILDFLLNDCEWESLPSPSLVFERAGGPFRGLTFKVVMSAPHEVGDWTGQLWVIKNGSYRDAESVHFVTRKRDGEGHWRKSQAVKHLIQRYLDTGPTWPLLH